jgi:hypothetical protein
MRIAETRRLIRAGIGRAETALALLERDAMYEADEVPALAALYALEKAHYKVERAQGRLVAALREAGYGWPEIGAELGLSRQGARKRYKRLGVR